MTFFESIKTVFRKYAEFEGRATRPEFWWFTLFSALVSAALGALTPVSANPNMFEISTYRTGVSGFISLAGAWSIVVLLPSLAVTVRRLRDAGYRWTQLFWILLPIAGLIVLIVRLTEPSITAGPPTLAPEPATATKRATAAGATTAAKPKG
ncbi:MAG: DUF805 domain-containing protein [Pseudolysinimonas sp.]